MRALALNRSLSVANNLKFLENIKMSKSQVMVIASTLVMVAGGSLGSAPDPNASELGFMLLLVGILLFIISGIVMLLKKEA